MFSEPSPVTIRFENMGGDENSFTEFNTIVYPATSEILIDAKTSLAKLEPVI